MTEPVPQDEMPAVIVTRKRGLSAVWIAPVLAALAVGYMVYDTISSRGPMITITFENAEGIVAGQSALKFEGVRVGTVEEVTADLRTGRVTLRSRLDASAAGLAVEGSQFWIQNPEIGLSGIASLDTLISGPYVASFAGTGRPVTAFEGMAERPPMPDSRPGLRLSLRAEVVVALRPGSPVLFRGIRVGMVDQIALAAADEHVLVDVFIDQDHASLVRSESSFWEISGVTMGFDPGNGLVLDTQSLRPIATGAIAFNSGPPGQPDALVTSGTSFTLHRRPTLRWTPPYVGEADAPAGSFVSASDLAPDGAPDMGEMLDHLASILRKVDAIDVAEGTTSLRELSALATRTLAELQLASAAANHSLAGVDRFLEQDGDLDRTVDALGVMARQLDSAAASLGAVLKEIEERHTIGDADRLITQLEAATPGLVQAMTDLGETLERIDGLVRSNGQPLGDTIRALRGASLQLQALLEDLRSNPSQLLSEPPSRRLPRSSP